MDFAGVSARLRALRQEQHLTQKVLAGRLGVTTDDLLGRSSGRPPLSPHPTLPSRQSSTKPSQPAEPAPGTLPGEQHYQAAGG